MPGSSLTPRTLPPGSVRPPDGRFVGGGGASRMERPKIGELLVAAGVIEPDVLEMALEKQRAQGGRLGGILVRMGALDEELLVRTVARQLEMPVAWLRGKQVKPEVLSQLPRG